MQNYFSCKNHPYFAKQTRSSSPRLDFDLWGNLQELRGIHPWFSGINFTFRNQAIRFLLPKLEIISWFLNNAKEKQCHFSFLDFHQMPNRNFICQNAEIFDRIRGFDQLIKGNDSWQDLRLWRGRSFDRRLCERHFRVTCGCSDGCGAGTRCRWVTIDYHIYIYVYIHTYSCNTVLTSVGTVALWIHTWTRIYLWIFKNSNIRSWVVTTMKAETRSSASTGGKTLSSWSPSIHGRPRFD